MRVVGVLLSGDGRDIHFDSVIDDLIWRFWHVVS